MWLCRTIAFRQPKVTALPRTKSPAFCVGPRGARTRTEPGHFRAQLRHRERQGRHCRDTRDLENCANCNSCPQAFNPGHLPDCCTSRPAGVRLPRCTGRAQGAPVNRSARPEVTRSRHRAEAFQIEAQAGPGSGIPPAKMSQRVSLSDGEGLLPSLCSDEPRAERTDQRVRQRSTHRVRDFVFARFAERPVFARPTETSCRIKQRATY